MTKEETIEVLLILKDKLENTNHFFMCWILQSINLPCTFLKESGLEAIWLSNPECIIKTAWLFRKNVGEYSEIERKSLKEKKIDGINILLKQLGHE